MRYPSLIVVLAMLAALAVFVWRARPASRLNRLFALQIFTFSMWTLGVAGLYNSSDHYDLWGGVCFAGASLIPGAFLSFVHYYPPESRWPSRTAIRATVRIGILFALISVATPWVVSHFEWRDGQLWRRAGPLSARGGAERRQQRAQRRHGRVAALARSTAGRPGLGRTRRAGPTLSRHG